MAYYHICSLLFPGGLNQQHPRLPIRRPFPCHPWAEPWETAIIPSLVGVEPTHSKNLLVRLDHFPRIRDENKQNI